MKKLPKGRKNKTEPVVVPPQYTLGLGYNPQDPAQSLDTILGKHQARYMENIFNEMNKFTKTAVMTVVPDLFAQLLNVLKSEKQRLIAEALDAEAGDDGPVEGNKETPVKNLLEAVPAPKEENVPQREMTKEEADAMRENNAEIVEKILEEQPKTKSSRNKPIKK